MNEAISVLLTQIACMPRPPPPLVLGAKVSESEYGCESSGRAQSEMGMGRGAVKPF